MINIITKPDTKHIINDFNAYFDCYVLPKYFDDMFLEAMYTIDSAILIDKELGTIQTKFGITDVLHLSLGCKIVLSYLYILKIENTTDKVLNITECGLSALEVLFSYADSLNDSSTKFLLRHSNQLFKCKDRAYNINGHTSTSLFKGIILYG